MKRADRHNEIELNFLSEGSLTYLFGGQVIRIEAPSVAVFWAAIPHQVIAHHAEHDYFVVTIPLSGVLKCKLPNQAAQALLHGHMICSPCPERVSIDQHRFSVWEEDLASQESERIKASHMEIEARLRRIALRWPGTAASVRQEPPKQKILVQDGGFAKAEEIARLIAERHTDALTIDTVANEVRLHRKLTQNLFINVFGASFIEYLTEHRIFHAQRMLLTTSMSVLDVAEAAGFGSLSHFNRAFQKYCGRSPREFRKSNTLELERPSSRRSRS